MIKLNAITFVREIFYATYLVTASFAAHQSIKTLIKMLSNTHFLLTLINKQNYYYFIRHLLINIINYYCVIDDFLRFL